MWDFSECVIVIVIGPRQKHAKSSVEKHVEHVACLAKPWHTQFLNRSSSPCFTNIHGVVFASSWWHVSPRMLLPLRRQDTAVVAINVPTPPMSDCFGCGTQPVTNTLPSMQLILKHWPKHEHAKQHCRLSNVLHVFSTP